MRHSLKIDTHYLENLKDGVKKCEIRYNDRDYQKDDVLVFYDYNEAEHVFFGVTHIHSGLGLKEGFVILSVERIDPCDITD